MKRVWTYLLALTALAACTKEPPVGPGLTGEEHDDAAANSWMYSMLTKYYLWNNEVLATTPDYDMPYDVFLKEFLSGLKTNTADGKRYSNGERYLYSYVSRRQSTKSSPAWESTYGFEWQLCGFRGTGNEVKYFARVKYVLPGSPAERAGLQRGTWIGRVNGNEINTGNYDILYQLYPQYSESVTVDTCTVSLIDLEGQTFVGIEHAGQSLRLQRAAVEDNPIFLDTVYNVAGGRKAAYLVYNSFRRGYVNNDDTSLEYEQSLREVFGRFRSAGVSDLVLDLRYNGGGYVKTCLLLASLCVPDALLGQKFVEMRYNGNIANSTGKLLSSAELGGSNIGMSRVYVLATDATASASEMIINGLRGLGLEVIHIGLKTEGKNVGMSLIDKNSSGREAIYNGYSYELWPVTFWACNARGEADYTDGFEPDYPFDEVFDDHDRWVRWHQLGDRREPMLDIALTLIEGGSVADKIDGGGSRSLPGEEFMRRLPGAPLPLPGGLLGEALPLPGAEQHICNDN